MSSDNKDHSPLLIEEGLVTQVDNQFAWVNTKSKLSCSSCKVESTCGNGILEKYLAGKIFVSKIPNKLNAKVGDEVKIGIKNSSITKASLMIYWLPLLGLILGSYLGQLLFQKEVLIILIGFTGFFISFLIIRLLNKKLESNVNYLPEMLSKKSNNFDPHPFQSIKIKNIS